MNTLDYILGVLDTLANIAEVVPMPGVALPAAYADKLLKVAQAAVAAHRTATGQPLDLSLLQPVELAPVALAPVNTAPAPNPISPAPVQNPPA